MLITSDNFDNKADYQEALENQAELCKSTTLTLVESLQHSCYNVPDFEKMDMLLKYAEGSIKKARKIIKNERDSREANRKRQQQTL